MSRHKYPGIEKAALLIALDNGGINRMRSGAKQKKDLYEFLAKREHDMLKPIDAWLDGLTKQQLDAVCCGGEGEPEQVAAMADCPPFTNTLLNDYFDEVC